MFAPRTSAWSIFSILVTTLCFETAYAEEPEVAWSYEDDSPLGPSHWGSLSEAFHACGDGLEQSPIDLGAALPEARPGSALRAFYGVTSFTVQNTGHTILVPFDGHGTMSFGSGTYDLQQFHVHAPSEHTVNGYSYPAELHFVHKNSEGQLSVLGVFVREGKHNRALEAILVSAPHEIATRDGVLPYFLPSLLLPSSFANTSYEGSLTTPPCTEGVHWIVLSTAIEASAAQIAHLHMLIKEVSGADYDGRPTQPVNDRPITSHAQR